MHEDRFMILNGDDVSALLRGREAEIIEAVRKAYVAHWRGRSSLPHSSFLHFPEDDVNRIIALPAFLGGGFSVAGLKWISSFPGNVANTYYGDGTPIEPEVMNHLREAYHQETVRFPWEQGDLLLLDNMLVAHGRAPFTGEKVLVGMAEAVTRDLASLANERSRGCVGTALAGVTADSTPTKTMKI